jgi:hypothetical protein
LDPIFTSPVFENFLDIGYLEQARSALLHQLMLRYAVRA